jgi:hypothetical protein
MKQFGEIDTNEFNYDTCCGIFRQLIERVEKENKVCQNQNLIEICIFLFQEREKRLAPNKSLVNSAKLPIQRLDSNKKTDENNFMDSLMAELKQKKFATVPARRQRIRPGLFDNDREVK